MNSPLSLLGRGLLVLALSGFAVACGDDDGPSPSDDSGVAGSGGRGGSGGAGSGGAGSGGSPADTGTGLTPQECEEMSVQAPGAECLACVCDVDPDITAACGEGCWGLVSCVGSRCGGDGGNTACILAMCGSFLVGDNAMQATAFGPVIGMCLDACSAPPVGTDAGTDDGGT
jgi:hypothetical protein